MEGKVLNRREDSEERRNTTEAPTLYVVPHLVPVVVGTPGHVPDNPSVKVGTPLDPGGGDGAEKKGRCPRRLRGKFGIERNTPKNDETLRG